jgi:4-nitrotryptophan synthase
MSSSQFISPLSDPSIVANPYPVYADLAEKHPVHWCAGLNAFAVMRYADCVKTLSDPRLRGERMASVLDVKFPNHGLAEDSIYHRFTKNVMMYTDPPKHDALRRATNPGFTREAHDHYDKLLKVLARELVSKITLGEIDAVPHLAAQMPVNAAVRAFGLPEEDLDDVLPRVQRIMTYWSGPQVQPIGLSALLEDLEGLHTYALELVQGARGKVVPDTVIARLAAAQATNVDSTLEQTIHQLVLVLVALFAPTTPGTLSSGLLAFAQNPKQIDRYRHGGEHADNAADEVLRYNASNQFTWRVAAETFVLGGIEIREGQTVVPFLGAANRDPSVFERPDDFSLARSNSGKNLSFGTGVHSCLGKHFVRSQVKRFYEAVFARFSSIRVVGEPTWNPNLEFRSLKSLPLQFA